MSPTLSLVLAALVGPGFESELPTGAKAANVQKKTEAAFTSVREAREAVSEVLLASNRASGRDPSETAPLVLAAYQRVERSENLPAVERRQLQSRLRARLSDQRQTLRRREERGGPSLGGGVVNGAQELINLIQTTIAPDTWEINGGKGSIYYFPNR
ncbi:MAG: hypothetical protein HY290_05005 [Planctomycetia bacterium]|nr:hypothetical protein [Planctomycetia bacterium]